MEANAGCCCWPTSFNLFNRRSPLDYDNYTEAAFGVLNPDFGRVIQYPDPIGARVGVRFDF